MLEDFRLKVFIAVASEGSFTKAAVRLGITQPAVSQHVAELEKVTGVRLFERLRSEVVLTDQGKIFKDHAERIISAYSSVENMFSRFPAATVRISATEEIFSNYVSPALDRFMAVHPDISFERAIFEDADLAIVMKPAPESPFEVPSDAVARIRISRSQPPKMGSLSAAHEKVSYFDILYQPTPAFECTRLCRVLREYIISF